MRKPIAYLVAAAVAVSGVLTGVAPASATMAGVASSTVNQAAERAAPGVEHVGWRGNRRYHRSNRSYRGSRYRTVRPYHHRRHYSRRHRSNTGAAVAAGILGFAAGAIASGALANRGGDWHAYCASKYRSYDARTGTFLGYDGRRHPCR